MRDRFLAAAGLLVFLWLAHRAQVQSITLDEANTWRHWVATDRPAHWEPHSNNHLLNSALMRLSVACFGTSELTLRLPALLGGLLYIFSVQRLSLALTDDRILRAVLFFCFVLNPFIMDLLVAARGYGLALGFQAAALALLVRRPVRLGWISACAALAVSANLAFAFVSVFMLGAGVLLARREHRWPSLLWHATAPAAVIAAAICGHTILHFPRSQLFWGTDSFLHAWREIRESSFSYFNGNLVNPSLRPVLEFVKRRIEFAALIAGVGFGIALWRGRSAFDAVGLQRAWLFFAILVLTVGAHAAQFWTLGIPLPFARTSIFVVPLVTGLLGAAAAAAPRATRAAITALLAISAVYFTACLRDGYFREWSTGADVKAAFPVVREQARWLGTRRLVTDQNFASSFDFYRIIQGAGDLDPVENFDALPVGERLYVLSALESAGFVRQHGLKPVWRGPITDLTVYVVP